MKFNANEYSDTFFDSDLATERRKADISIPGVKFEKDKEGVFSWERITITSEEGAKSIGRPCGIYNTFSCQTMQFLSDSLIEEASSEISAELCMIFEENCFKSTRLLIVGLGNYELTPDSIGPKTASKINATMHIKLMNKELFSQYDCSEIAVFTPGVMAQTGIETLESVLSVCDKISPDAVIAIDSLAARSHSRLGTTIQIADSGIFPGSGLGNHRNPLTKNTLGVPVIAIGVPTVINARIFAKSNDIKTEMGYDMFVAPREIDTISNVASKIISNAINQSFGIF